MRKLKTCFNPDPRKLAKAPLHKLQKRITEIAALPAVRVHVPWIAGALPCTRPTATRRIKIKTWQRRRCRAQTATFSTVGVHVSGILCTLSRLCPVRTRLIDINARLWRRRWGHRGSGRSWGRSNWRRFQRYHSARHDHCRNHFLPVLEIRG